MSDYVPPGISVIFYDPKDGTPTVVWNQEYVNENFIRTEMFGLEPKYELQYKYEGYLVTPTSKHMTVLYNSLTGQTDVGYRPELPKLKSTWEQIKSWLT